MHNVRLSFFLPPDILSSLRQKTEKQIKKAKENLACMLAHDASNDHICRMQAAIQDMQANLTLLDTHRKK